MVQKQHIQQRKPSNTFSGRSQYLNIAFLGDFGKFSSQIYQLKMTLQKGGGSISLKQELHLDSKYLIGFLLDLRENIKPDYFSQGSENKDLDPFT